MFVVVGLLFLVVAIVVVVVEIMVMIPGVGWEWKMVLMVVCHRGWVSVVLMWAFECIQTMRKNALPSHWSHYHRVSMRCRTRAEFA